MLHDEFLYDRLNSNQSHTCYLGQENFHSYMLLVLHWVSSSFVDPYERFVMLLKSRSRTHHPNMHYSYTRGRHKNMPSIQIHPKKCYILTLGVNTRNMLIRFPIHQINAPSSCCYLSKVLLQKRDMGYAKVIHKKRKEKKKRELRKNGQVSEIFKTMGTQMPA